MNCNLFHAQSMRESTRRRQSSGDRHPIPDGPATRAARTPRIRMPQWRKRRIWLPSRALAADARLTQIDSAIRDLGQEEHTRRGVTADSHPRDISIAYPLFERYWSASSRFTIKGTKLAYGRQICWINAAALRGQSRSCGVLTFVSSRRCSMTMRWVSPVSTSARMLRSPSATRASARAASAVR